MSKIKCIETNKVKNPQLLANVVFNNFLYLTHFPDLQHTKTEIVKTLNLESCLCYLLYDDTKLIGYLIGDFRTFPDNRYGFYVSYVYISSKYRNRKLGSELMNQLIKKCNNIGTKFIVLTCDTNDEKVVKFYEKLGFVIDSSLGENKRRHNVYCLYL